MFFRALLFSSYGEAKDLTADLPSSFRYFIAGALTGATISLAESPIDFFKSQVQVQVLKAARNPGVKPEFAGVIDCAQQVWRHSGVRGAYQGLSGTIIRNTPANGLYFGTYEATRQWLRTRHAESGAALPAGAVLTAGGLGGFVYWLCTYPTDVVKSALQTDAVDRAQRKYSGWVDCAKKLYHEEGWHRFYRGLTPCLLRSVPANAVLFLVVEQSRFWLEKII